MPGSARAGLAGSLSAEGTRGRSLVSYPATRSDTLAPVRCALPVLVCLLAQGHLLIEGVPGLAKTLTIKTTAGVLGGSFARVQFTPDLVPSDLVGTRIYRVTDGSFDTELGPVFCNFLLADEINRAPAKVQSALLEVMQERQVTIGHDGSGPRTGHIFTSSHWAWQVTCQ